MILNNKEIETLNEVMINNLDCKKFEIKQEQNPVGVVTEVWVPDNSTPFDIPVHKVFNITDYECW